MPKAQPYPKYSLDANWSQAFTTGWKHGEEVSHALENLVRSASDFEDAMEIIGVTVSAAIAETVRIFRYYAGILARLWSETVRIFENRLKQHLSQTNELDDENELEALFTALGSLFKAYQILGFWQQSMVLSWDEHRTAVEPFREDIVRIIEKRLAPILDHESFEHLKELINDDPLLSYEEDRDELRGAYADYINSPIE